MDLNALKAFYVKERIEWVDILRFLGMVLIYWGHLGASDSVTLYIYAHHVPLFFFISGFFAEMRPHKGGFLSFLWKKIRSLVLPYIVFTLLYYVLQLATGQISFSQLPAVLLVSAQGIRNQVPGPLWFLTCLFVLSIGFELLKRIICGIFGKGKASAIVLFILAAAVYLVGILFLGHEPAQDPQWIWNVDSACVYIIYYALGALLFPVIKDWKFKEKKAGGRIVFFIFFFLSVLFGAFMMLRGAEFTENVRTFLGSVSAGIITGDVLFEVFGLLCAVILIFMELCFARMIALVPGIRSVLGYIGKGSLYLCGNELIIKYFGGLGIAALGITPLLENDLFLLFYSILCIVVSTFTLNMLERLLFGKLFGTGEFNFQK